MPNPETNAKADVSDRSVVKADRAEGADRLSRESANTTPLERAEGRASVDTKPSTLTPEQLKKIDTWRSNERQINAFNSQHDKDGGAETQNGVYKLTVEELKRQGLDKKGWEALPVGMGSPLDKIGADIVLVNRNSGDVIFIDPTSRRLDGRTGEPLSHSESAKTNVPGLRADGVVDALPSWFDKMSSNLKFDHDNPVMQERIKEFSEDFRFKIADLTSRKAPFNLKDFPLPSPLPAAAGDQVGQAREASQIKAVVDWSNAKSEVLRRSGDYTAADQHREFGKIVGGALNFTVRVESPKLEEALHRNAARVIVEDAIAKAYPGLVHEPHNSRNMANLDGGGRIMVDKQGQLVAEVPDRSQAAGKYVVTGGNTADVFKTETINLIMARNNPAKMEAFVHSLPASIQKRIEKGEIKPAAILAKIEENRAAYSAGGYGEERPLLGRLVEKLSNGGTNGLRSLVEDVVANDNKTTKPVEPEKVVVKEREQPVRSDSKWQKEAPTLGSLASAQGNDGGDKNFVPLSAAEVQKLRDERVSLEMKGNLSPQEHEQVRALQFAETQLTKPGNESWKADLIAHIRKTMRGETRGAVMGVAILSSAMLSWVATNPGAESRAAFGQSY